MNISEDFSLSPAAVNDPYARMMTTERDQYVIVVPDTMKTNPVDSSWVTENNAYRCQIIKLGLTIAKAHFSEIADARYRDLILKMIAAGVRVIRKADLREVNGEYLEVYPDAEGSEIRRTKPLLERIAPFEINVPANTACTMDIAWPNEGKQVLARLNPMHDEGDEWGIGLALGWPDGQYVQINARTDGFWGIRRNGHEYLCGSYIKSTLATAVIILDHKRVQLNAQLKTYQYVAEFARNQFPRVPSIIRIGKIGKTWNPQSSDVKGSATLCRIDWVKIY